MSASLRMSPSGPEPTDAQLVAQVLTGQTDAYGTLVLRHQQLIYRHARGMGIDHDTSVDLVQDAFVKAFDRLDDCREGANYRSWLFRICRNLCLDELRNVRRLSVPMSALENSDALEDRRSRDNDLTMTLRAALDRLPQALREAFLLKHDAGYTYEEVAEITEATPSAVKMRVHRAREVLRAFLSAQGVVGSNELDDESDNRATEKRLTNEGA
ncbi:MAG TPA: sigma-70 family RNA polymerase sigma factor [Gemmatimonadaceae bacterium]|nr:sigma-70 family RNA polymerase sigma factor [Gemmatimonadaceae bacterium]